MRDMIKYILAGLIGSICALATVFIVKDDSGDIKFVSMTQLFAESNIKKEYEKKLNEFEEESNAKLQVFQDKIKSGEVSGEDPSVIQSLRQELSRQQAELSEMYSQKSQDFQATVWDELNTRVEAYGKERGYKFILGGTGDGTIMYASEMEDITEEVINYLNAK